MNNNLELITITDDHFLRLYRNEVRTIIYQSKNIVLLSGTTLQVTNNGKQENSFTVQIVWSKLIFEAQNGFRQFQIGLAKC